MFVSMCIATESVEMSRKKVYREFFVVNQTLDVPENCYQAPDSKGCVGLGNKLGKKEYSKIQGRLVPSSAQDNLADDVCLKG